MHTEAAAAKNQREKQMGGGAVPKEAQVMINSLAACAAHSSQLSATSAAHM